ncbi:hypothetical protein G7Y79_00014g037480 [Physcia stellaris]|nr:hypothetical protein G7Y79_00014g037480 [Physcia stellaris]
MRPSRKRKPLSTLPLHLLLFLSLIPTLHAVDVTILYIDDNRPGLVHVTCTNLPPGVCCSVPTIQQRNPTTDRLETKTAPAKSLLFEHLIVGDIAAAWKRREPGPEDPPTAVQTELNGCSSRILNTGHGPAAGWEDGEYTHDGGVLGLVYGGSQWFASAAAARVVARAQGGLATFPKKAKRGIRSELKGTVYAQGPSKWVYPDKVQVNGTEYFGGGTNLVYESKDGRLLNLTSASESGG